MSYDPNVYEEVLIEIDEDTRILARIHPTDDTAPVILLNDDDLAELNSPPEGSPLRERLLFELGQWWLKRNSEPKSVKTFRLM